MRGFRRDTRDENVSTRARGSDVYINFFISLRNWCSAAKKDEKNETEIYLTSRGIKKKKRSKFKCQSYLNVNTRTDGINL